MCCLSVKRDDDVAGIVGIEFTNVHPLSALSRVCHFNWNYSDWTKPIPATPKVNQGTDGKLIVGSNAVYRIPTSILNDLSSWRNSSIKLNLLIHMLDSGLLHDRGFQCDRSNKPRLRPCFKTSRATTNITCWLPSCGEASSLSVRMHIQHFCFCRTSHPTNHFFHVRCLCSTQLARPD